MGTRLEAIRARERAATRGPWLIPEDDQNGRILNIGPIAGYDYDALEMEHDDPNALFVQHAREDVPWLLAEVERLRGVLATAVAELDECTGDCHCRSIDVCEDLRAALKEAPQG